MSAHRAPLLAGLLVLAFFAAMPLLPGGLGRTRIVPPAAIDATSGLGAATFATTNVRDLPDPQGAVVAVLPAGRHPELLGRTADGTWLAIAFGTTAEEHGWLPANRLDLPASQREALRVMVPPATSPSRASAAAALPDLTLGAVYLMRDGRIALDIRNDGEGTLRDTKIPLLVTRASGETVGVLEIGPATLGPRGIATIVTPIVVTSTGTYTLELDRQESITETVRTNNSVTRLLVVGGG